MLILNADKPLLHLARWEAKRAKKAATARKSKSRKVRKQRVAPEALTPTGRMLSTLDVTGSYTNMRGEDVQIEGQHLREFAVVDDVSKMDVVLRKEKWAPDAPLMRVSLLGHYDDAVVSPAGLPDGQYATERAPAFLSGNPNAPATYTNGPFVPLRARTIADLRKLAISIGLTGASKIKGGKKPLVEVIEGFVRVKGITLPEDAP